jgi:hypothetical protein
MHWDGTQIKGCIHGWLTCWVALAGVCLAASGPARGEASSQDDEYLVGVYYFAGWWRALPNKWERQGRDWRADWEGRVPTLGEYNEQATMDREIVAAAEHSVDFFQILYYCQPPGKPPEPNADRLNVAVDQFMASPHAGRMKFTIETVNHPPYDAPSEQEWSEACKVWAKAMRHPSYLRIGGLPVFKIHGYELFLKGVEGKREAARARLEVLRKAVRDAGAGEVLLSAGILPEQIFQGKTLDEFSFLTTYMWMPQLPQVEPPYPYARLIDYAEAGWKIQNEKGSKHYVPYVPAGWDPRPWKDPRCSFEMPTRQQWTDALQRAKRALDKNSRLGVPTKDGGRQKMLLIYAWNEFGEGGIVAPTRGEADMKLEAIREVFGSSREH